MCFRPSLVAKTKYSKGTLCMKGFGGARRYKLGSVSGFSWLQ